MEQGALGLAVEQMQRFGRQHRADLAADRRIDHAMGDRDQQVAADLDAEMALVAQPVVGGDDAAHGARAVAEPDTMRPDAEPEYLAVGELSEAGRKGELEGGIATIVERHDRSMPVQPRAGPKNVHRRARPE